MKSIFQAVDQSDPNSIAHEALIMAEHQFMTDDYPKEFDEDAMMYFKDDNGDWCMIHDKHGQYHEKYSTYEELAAHWNLEEEQ